MNKRPSEALGLLLVLFLLNFSACDRSATPMMVPTFSPIPSQTASYSSPEPSMTPTVTRPIPRGRIVYTCQLSKHSEHNEICLMNADGSGFLQLTDNGANNGFPSFAPDGQSIVYTSNLSGSWQIYEIALKTLSIRQLTYGPGEASAPTISPDGSRIVYKCSSALLDSICVMNRDGSNPQKIYTPGWDPVWSPDGRQILFASGPLDQPSLYIVAADGSAIHQILTLKDMRGRSDWSSQGYIATYAGQPWERNIYLWNGEAWKQLTTGGNSVGPSFSPDGNWIAFTAYFDHMGDPDGCEIYVMTIDGQNLKRLTDNGYCDWQPRWGVD